MKVLALYNLKGGVGKTAASVNLAWLAARAGRRTLLWDLDPQASATFYLRVKAKVRGGGRSLIEEGRDLDPLIRGSDFPGLDLLPADFSYRKLDRALEATDDPAEALRQRVAPLAQDYDLLVLDCSPSVSTLSEAVFSLADALAVPIIPTTLSLRTLARLMKHLKKHPERPLVLPFFSMVDARKSMHRRMIEFVEQEGLGFLPAQIPYSGIVEQMGFRRAPVGTYAPRSKPAEAYGELWEQIADRLDSGEDSNLTGRSPRRALEEIARRPPERRDDGPLS